MHLINGDGFEQCEYEDCKLTLATSFVMATCCYSTLGDTAYHIPLQRSLFNFVTESFSLVKTTETHQQWEAFHDLVSGLHDSHLKGRVQPQRTRSNNK